MNMISFACRKIELKDLLTCSFDLNRTDYNLFLFLLEQRGFLTTNEIARKMRLERSSVQKSIKRLVEKTLAVRHQENLDGGGYLFVYRIKDKEAIKNQMLAMIESWNSKVRKEIDGW